MSVVVEQIVGEFEFIKRHDLFHPLRSLGRRVRVHVDASGHVWIGLSSHHPAGRVETVPVTLVVARNEVHHEHVVGHRIKTVQTHLKCRKHTSAIICNKITNY